MMKTEQKVKKLIASYGENGYLNGALFVAEQGEIIESKGYGNEYTFFL